MHPILFTIGEKLTIYSYGFMIAIGMITCVVVAYLRAGKRYATDPDIIFNCALIGIVSGMIGAKLTYWIVELLKDPKSFDFGWQIKNFTAGFVIYGGLILGVLCCLFYVKKMKKMSFARVFDIAAPSIAIGQGIGRIGCFLAGCCFGKEIPAGHWLSFIGVTFPNEALCEAPAGVLLWPTQLISAAADLLLAAFLIWYTDRERFAGEVSVFYIGLYAIGRFLVEFIRGDEARGSVGFLSTSQFIAVFMLVLAVALWFFLKKLNVEPLRPVGAYVKPDDDDEDDEDDDDDEEDEEPEESLEQAEEKAEEALEQAEEKAEDALEQAEEKAEEAIEEAGEKAEEVLEQVEKKAEETVVKAEEKAEEVLEKVEEKAEDEKEH